MTTLNIISEECDEDDNITFYISSDEFSEDETENNDDEMSFSETEYEKVSELAKKCERKLQVKPLKFNGYNDENTFFIKKLSDSKNTMTTEFRKVKI